MTRFSKLLVTAFVIAAGIVAPLSAQQFSQTVNVTLVEIPVTVVDRGGNAVTGLKKSDFQLYDDGKKVPISSFDTINFDQLTAKGAHATSLPPAASRNFMLLFDLSHSTPGTIDRARDAAKTFVNSEMKAFDRASVATYSVDHGLKLITAFTNDRDLLTSAITTLGVPKYFKVGDPLFISNTAPPAGPSSASEGADARADAAQALQELTEDTNRTTQTHNDSYMRERLRSELQGLAGIARALDSIRGQKEVILLSEGFDARLVQGRSTTAPGTTQDREAIMRGQIEKIDSDQMYGNVSSSNDLSDMAKVFRRSDVVMHAIDIKGLRSDVDASAGAKKSSNEGLYLLTHPTGGTVFKNTNDLGQTFSNMLREQRITYVLGYQTDATGSPGKFHDLKVKVSGQPRGTRVNARAGYYEPAPLKGLGAVLSTSQILTNDIAVDDIPMGMMATPFPMSGDKAQVPVELEIEGAKLTQNSQGNTASGNLFVYAFGPLNKVEDYTFQKIALDLSKVGDTLKKSGIRYYGTLSLPPGKYTIKALLKMNESGYETFRKEEVVVPDFKQTVVLQPFMFVDPGDWIMLRGNSARAGNPAYPFVVGPNSFIPAAECHLKKDGTYKVALFTYHVSPDGLGLGAMVRDSKGEITKANVKLVGRTPVADDGSMQLLFDFSPKDLAAGKWDLEFTLTPKGGEARVSRLPFVVE